MKPLLALLAAMMKKLQAEPAEPTQGLSLQLAAPSEQQVLTAVPSFPVPREEPVQDSSNGPCALLEGKCFQLGYETARDSGAIKPDDATLKALESRAQALAMTIHRAYCEAADQRMLAKLQALEEARERQIVERDRAAVQLDRWQHELAKLGPRQECPALSPILRYAAIISLVLSLSPTTRDLFVGLDPFLKWVAGIGCSYAVSLLIVHGILPDSSDRN